MKIDTPDGTLEIPESKAVIKNHRGVDVVVIDNRYFFTYSDYDHRRFCGDTDYHDIVDMLPESITVKPILNDESLLAYAWWNKRKWDDIDHMMIAMRNRINELEDLIK